jgi:uncharacterized damage-inducible protein DinB
MLNETLAKLYESDLGLLTREIDKYVSTEDLWKVEGQITNSAGNLAMHICGNLQHFIGTVLGGSDYIRERDLEFSKKNVSPDTLKNEIEITKAIISKTLSNLADAELEKPYPIEVFGRPMSTEYFLVHLATHLNYHLGQINYHRRLLTAE